MNLMELGAIQSLFWSVPELEAAVLLKKLNIKNWIHLGDQGSNEAWFSELRAGDTWFLIISV